MIGVREKAGPTPLKIRGERVIDGRLRKRFMLVFVGVELSAGKTSGATPTNGLTKCYVIRQLAGYNWS